ncbi:helix-turn-helix domain-containing protein [Geotalea toluenoxydans]|uniref:helix-turn-helix domain-containing protein n=1 Tax=Geotalea toluenoxydans TaxID=421624 RepID=UPI000B0FF331|nr:helix-turn-helix domain-containing protein [Geotalea toluenoxydans]
MLVSAMVKEFAGAFGKAIERVPKKNMDALVHYTWPGNIRELRNMVERAMILSNGPVLEIDIPDGTSTTIARAALLKEVEQLHILSIMEKTGWRIRGKSGAAELLGLKPTTLESRMKKLGIKRCLSPSEIS